MTPGAISLSLVAATQTHVDPFPLVGKALSHGNDGGVALTTCEILLVSVKGVVLAA